MQEQTTRLGLPYILPSQAQKHVPHNEALDALDGMVQLAIAGILNSPPPSPADGVCFGVDAEPTGAWSNAAGKVAQWRDGTWHFVQPHEGWLAWCVGEQRLYVHDGSRWQRFAQMPCLGVNATADETNRLTVASEASLFTHAGVDHRLKINKATSGDTASLLFQTGWSGHAELGLAGSNDFTIKVASGGDWRVALSIGATGHVATPMRPAARAWLAAGIITPPTDSFIGFTNTGFATGGFVLGDAVPAGTGNRLIAPVTAHYLVNLCVVPATVASCNFEVVVDGVRTVIGTASLSGAPTGRKLCVSGIAPIPEGEWIALRYQGGAAVDFDFDKTELFVAALT